MVDELSQPTMIGMNTSIDPALVGRLSAGFTALGNQMGGLGRDLEILRTQVLADQVPRRSSDTETAPPKPADQAGGESGAQGGQPAPPSASPQGGSGPIPTWPSNVPTVPTYQPPVGPLPAYPTDGAPGAVPPGRPGPPVGAEPGASPPPPSSPARPPTPWWQRDGVISRVLAVAGVAVTLIGVVMLLVLAAQAGFFGAVPRVVSGAVLAAALVGAGARVYNRTGGRVGGIALSATGIAGAFLDVIAVTTIYEWLPPAAGLALAVAIAAAGVGLAVRWDSQPFAVLVVAGAAIFAPFVTTEAILLAFLIVLHAACTPVQLGRDWPFLHAFRTAPAAVATLIYIGLAAESAADHAQPRRLLIAAVVIAGVGLLGSLVVLRRNKADVMATVAFAVSAVPLIVVPVLFDRKAAVAIAAGYAAVLLVLAALAVVPKARAVGRVPDHLAAAAAVAGAAALLEACVGLTDEATLPMALLLIALGFLGVGGQARSLTAAVLGAAFGTIGAVAFSTVANPENLTVQRLAEERLGAATALAALLGIAVVWVGVWAQRRLSSDELPTHSLLWTVAGAATLYLVTAATVAVGASTGAADGFIVGHCVATVVWMVSATAALFYGLRNLSGGSGIARIALGSGLLVTTAALAKLFLFDLATLDGLVRVVAFLAVGILLLVVGTRYARAFAEVGSRSDTQ